LNINLSINNEKQDYKIGTVFEGVLVGRGEGMKEMKVRNIVDELYIYIFMK
jgi:hypothetical protein